MGMNSALLSLFLFSFVAYAMFLVSLWESVANNIGLVVIGAQMVVFCTFNPYLMSLVDWRNAIHEESEALIHSSKGMNKFLKMILTLSIMTTVSTA
jgi:hypothetical protein